MNISWILNCLVGDWWCQWRHSCLQVLSNHQWSHVSFPWLKIYIQCQRCTVHLEMGLRLINSRVHPYLIWDNEWINQHWLKWRPSTEQTLMHNSQDDKYLLYLHVPVTAPEQHSVHVAVKVNEAICSVKNGIIFVWCVTLRRLCTVEKYGQQ